MIGWLPDLSKQKTFFHEKLTVMTWVASYRIIHYVYLYIHTHTYVCTVSGIWGTAKPPHYRTVIYLYVLYLCSIDFST